MDNLYKAPDSSVSDLTLVKKPAALQKILNLIKLAFLMSVLQFVAGVVIDPEIMAFDGEFSIAFILFLIGIMSLFWFLVYYLCLWLPVKRGKRRAAYWVFVATLFLTALGVYVEFFSDGPELQVSLLEKLLMLAEVLILFYAAYLLTRPEYRVNLLN